MGDWGQDDQNYIYRDNKDGDQIPLFWGGVWWRSLMLPMFLQYITYFYMRDCGQDDQNYIYRDNKDSDQIPLFEAASDGGH